MGQNIEVIKYFPRDAYGMSDVESPVKLIGDGPKNAKGEITSTIIRVSPTPFGSPTKRDLHGQFFKGGLVQPEGPGTYFGDDIVTTKFGLYEHGMNDINNAEMGKFGKLSNILGPAHLVKNEGDPTRWFDIEVKRALQYHDWLLDLVDLKIMGASTQAFLNNVVVDEQGGIDVWVENEVGPTVSPANPESIKQMASLLKSPKFISLPPVSVKMFKNEQLVEVAVVEPEAVSEETTSLADEIEAILADETPQPEVTEATEAIAEAIPNATPELVEAIEKAVAAQVKAQMSVFIELWGSDVNEAREAIMAMMGSSKEITDVKAIAKELLTSNEDMKKSFLMFARAMKSMRMSQAADTVIQMSQLEREILAEQEQQKQSQQPNRRIRGMAPQGAPGTY